MLVLTVREYTWSRKASIWESRDSASSTILTLSKLFRLRRCFDPTPFRSESSVSEETENLDAKDRKQSLSHLFKYLALSHTKHCSNRLLNLNTLLIGHIATGLEGGWLKSQKTPWSLRPGSLAKKIDRYCLHRYNSLELGSSDPQRSLFNTRPVSIYVMLDECPVTRFEVAKAA